MRRTSRVFSVGSAIALGAASVAAGCVDNNESIFIQQVAIPLNLGTMCTLSNDPTMPPLSEGILDLSIADSYILNPLIRNELISRRDGTNFHAETNTAVIQGYVIEIHQDSPTGPPIGPAFTVYETLAIPPGMSGAVSYGVAQVTIIPPAITSMIFSTVCRVDNQPGHQRTSTCPVPFLLSDTIQLIARVTAFGQTTGGVNLQAPEFDFPVSACCHCLVQFTPDSILPPSTGMGGTGHNSPNCLNGIAPITVAQCAIGQDWPVDCRLCSGSNIVCQPNGFTPDPNAPSGTCPSQ